jgi:hypothetical protein
LLAKRGKPYKEAPNDCMKADGGFAAEGMRSSGTVWAEVGIASGKRKLGVDILDSRCFHICRRGYRLS